MELPEQDRQALIEAARRRTQPQEGGAAFKYPSSGKRPEKLNASRDVNMPAQMARGWVAGTLGLPGDIEALGRMGINFAFGRGGVNVDETPVLPTTEFYQEYLPGGDERPAAKFASGLGALGGGMGSTTLARGAVKGSKAVGRALGPKAAEMAEGYLQRSGLAPQLTVYHGTPHKFAPEEGAPLGKFRSEKIGTGEGAQAYGQGLYTAEAKEVGSSYQKSLSDFDMFVDGKPFDSGNPAHRAALELKQSGGEPGRQELIEKYKRQIVDLKSRDKKWATELAASKEAELPFLESGDLPAYSEQSRGYLYTADLPDEMIPKMLDWDKPLSQQSPDVQEALQNSGLLVDVSKVGEVAAEKIRRLAEQPRVADWAKRDLLQTAAQLEKSPSPKHVAGVLKGMQLEYGINADSGPFSDVANDFLSFVKGMQAVPNMDTGGGAVSYLEAMYGPANASQRLKEAGIPGIKYLDEQSRGMTGTGKWKVDFKDGTSQEFNFKPNDDVLEQMGATATPIGTRNFVIFPGEEQKLRILQRNEEKLPDPAGMIKSLEEEAKAIAQGMRNRAKADRAAGLDQISDETLLRNREDSDRIHKLMVQVEELKRPQVKIAAEKPDPSWMEGLPDAQRKTVKSFDEWQGDRGFSLRKPGSNPEDDLHTSAQSNFTDYEVVPKVRSIPLDALGGLGGYDSPKELARIENLAQQIEGNKEITPIFVGVDATGMPYVIEGQHRARAFKNLGMQSIPAKVIVDMTPEIGRAEGGLVTDTDAIAAKLKATGMDDEKAFMQALRMADARQEAHMAGGGLLKALKGAAKAEDVAKVAKPAKAAAEASKPATKVVSEPQALQKAKKAGYPMAPRNRWYGEGTYDKSGGRLEMMSPDEFLNKVRPLEIDDASRDNIDYLKQHIQSGGELDPLLITKSGKEDGRHRAYAAKELGISELPVIRYDKEIPAAPQAEALETARKNAVKMLGLPENNTAMDRAKAMGFDTQGYRGSTAVETTHDKPVWWSEDPDYANAYAAHTVRPPKGQPDPYAGNVMPLLVKVGKDKTFEKFSPGGVPLDPFSGFNEGVETGLRRYAHNQFTGDMGGKVWEALTVPKNVRSRFAAFDPARSSENDLLGAADPALLAGVAVGSGIGIDAIRRLKKEEQKPEEQKKARGGLTRRV